MHIEPDIEICQTDYPIDWYQEEFIPYAEEYLALPNRKFSTILNWMNPYMKAAQDHFGDSLMLLTHFYMGGVIVKLIEQFGGAIGDSYQLALMAFENPEKKVIIEAAVHFMAESIAILGHADQNVYITNPKSGCTMEMLAKDYMVEPAFVELSERYGKDCIVPICYMNTSGRIKAMTGALNGAVCTSSNVRDIFKWATRKNKKIFFLPDRNMGENTAAWAGIAGDDIAYWPSGYAGANFSLYSAPKDVIKRFDQAKLIIFSSECGVHSYYKPEMVCYWQDRGFHVVVHPECCPDVYQIADSAGSTSFIWDQVAQDKACTKKYAIGTENHMVKNVKQHCAALGIEVVNLGEANVKGHAPMGCGCATMSRNDPPHLVALLDLLRQGKKLEYNRVEPGDTINEVTGTRERLDAKGQKWIIENAKKSLENMIRIAKEA